VLEMTVLEMLMKTLRYLPAAMPGAMVGMVTLGGILRKLETLLD